MSPAVTSSYTQFQPEAYTFDSGILVRPLLNISIADRLYPTVTRGSIEDLQAYYRNITTLSKPDYLADVEFDRKAEVLSSNKVTFDYPLLQKDLKWNVLEFQRVNRDIADVNEHVAGLAPVFRDMRDSVFLAGHTNPAVPGLMDSTRSTDTSITNKDATTFAGWMSMITELRADLRTRMKQAYNRLPQWLCMTSDVYELAEATYATYEETMSVLDVLTSPAPKGFGPNVFWSDHLGATVTDNVSAEDGTTNIVLGTYSPETAVTLQTGFQMMDVSDKKYVDYMFMQRYLPKTLRSTGFIQEPDVTVT